MDSKENVVTRLSCNCHIYLKLLLCWAFTISFMSISGNMSRDMRKPVFGVSDQVTNRAVQPQKIARENDARETANCSFRKAFKMLLAVI